MKQNRARQECRGELGGEQGRAAACGHQQYQVGLSGDPVVGDVKLKHIWKAQ